MEQTTAAGPDPKPESHPAPPPPQGTEAKYRRRAALLGSPRAKTVFVVILVVLLVGGFFLWRYFASYEFTDDAQIDGHINSVSARVSGHVTKLNVEDNQYVEKGTLLVEIDPTDYQVAVDRARADYADAQAQASAAGINIPVTDVSTSSQVASAQANVANTKSGIVAARQQLDAAQAQVAEAEANDAKAQSDLVRYKQLIDKQEISHQQYDAAVAAAKSGTANVAAAKSAAAAATAQVEQAQSKLAQAEADLRTAQTAPQTMRVIRARAASAQAVAERKRAELQQAELNLQYTKVVAPVTGAVTGRTVEVGQNVQVGGEMMKIIPLEDIWVTANFKETQLREMKAGQRSTIDVDANGKSYKGHVESIAGASGARFSLLPPENATGNYVKVVQRIPVKIILEPGETKAHDLRPGMSVTPKVWIR